MVFVLFPFPHSTLYSSPIGRAGDARFVPLSHPFGSAFWCASIGSGSNAWTTIFSSVFCMRWTCFFFLLNAEDVKEEEAQPGEENRRREVKKRDGHEEERKSWNCTYLPRSIFLLWLFHTLFRQHLYIGSCTTFCFHFAFVVAPTLCHTTPDEIFSKKSRQRIPSVGKYVTSIGCTRTRLVKDIHV